MKTYRQFIESVEDTGYLSEMQFPNPFAGIVRDVKTASDVFQYATGIKKPPVNIPAVKDLLLKGSQVPNFSNIRYRIGTPQPSAPVAPKPTPRGGGGPISTVITALTNLQGDTPQTRSPQQIRDRDAAIQKRWSKEMNLNPSKFDMAGPDVVVPKPAGPDQGVGTKPRVAEPYTPPRPAASKVEPKVTIPKADNPRRDPFAPVERSRSVTTERPRVAPKPEKTFSVGNRQLTKSQINTEYQRLRTSNPTKAKEFGLAANKAIYGR